MAGDRREGMGASEGRADPALMRWRWHRLGAKGYRRNGCEHLRSHYAGEVSRCLTAKAKVNKLGFSEGSPTAWFDNSPLIAVGCVLKRKG